MTPQEIEAYRRNLREDLKNDVLCSYIVTITDGGMFYRWILTKARGPTEACALIYSLFDQHPNFQQITAMIIHPTVAQWLPKNSYYCVFDRDMIEQVYAEAKQRHKDHKSDPVEKMTATFADFFSNMN